ncbi:nucleotidyltransferase domain-containing protein [Streptomyces sp. NPDC057253]|uniref:nucleotidyltransferase domain-containing protein n=1 Tax=Streptomyces sp. NPDC057253 TaxID=3346069 RepID=UPI003639C1D8
MHIRPGRRPDAPGATRATRRALRAARSVGRAVDRSPFGFLVAIPMLQREVMRTAPAVDVLAVLDALNRADVRRWLAGGWGVDALMGLQTRRHLDIDVVLAWEDGVEERAKRAMAGLGYRPLSDEVHPDGRPMPVRWVMDDGLVVVDLLPVDLARWPFAALLNGHTNGRRAATATTANSTDPTLDDCGTIAGHPVPCLPLRLQLVVHQGYPTRKSDRHDVALLEELLVRRRRSP